MNYLIQSAVSPPPEFQHSPGEIHFLWWFIQGGIMDSIVRKRMRKAWGLCERHTWGWMSTEAAFRRGYMLGPVVLYDDLMEQALAAFQGHWPMQFPGVRLNLRQKGSCFMCEDGFGPNTKGIVKPELVEKGRDLSELRALAERTRPHWQKTVCGKCAGTSSNARCRKHFLEGAGFGSVKDFHRHKEFVTYIAEHLAKYKRSFRFGFHGTQTEEDMAALITAVGWCIGWTLFLSIVNQARSNNL